MKAEVKAIYDLPADSCAETKTEGEFFIFSQFKRKFCGSAVLVSIITFKIIYFLTKRVDAKESKYKPCNDPFSHKQHKMIFKKSV